MALCRVKTGHLTWRSVTLSTRQKKGMCYFGKLWKIHEHDLHPVVLSMWGGAMSLGADARSLNVVCIGVALFSCSLDISENYSMMQRFPWSVSAWEGWHEKCIAGEGTEFVLLGFLFSAGVSLCSAAMLLIVAIWIESFSDTSPSASEKLCCLQFAGELV